PFLHQFLNIRHFLGVMNTHRGTSSMQFLYILDPFIDFLFVLIRPLQLLHRNCIGFDVLLVHVLDGSPHLHIHNDGITLFHCGFI
ncbi:hypothetical protein PENTCL1PPCAC_10833, partial [Pristionchus entomophagus]